MTNENLQINIGANTQDLQNGLNQASQAVNNFGQQLSRVSKPTADATQSLVNLSRIAQDAPYGFMGIANNLNPMLESFQRLQKESGSTGEALKAMVAGMMGPAGLGVALGVVSSLVVAFGSDIADFFAKLTGGNEQLQQTNRLFHESKDAFTKAYVEMQTLGEAFEAFHNGTKSKKEVLEQYNNTLGKVYGSTKDIGEAEKLYIADSDKYVKAAMYRAAALLAAGKAAEQAFKQQEILNNPNTVSRPLEQRITSYLTQKATGVDLPTLNEAGAVSKAESLEKVFLNIEKAFNKMVDETNKTAEKSKLFGKEDKKEKDYTLDDQIAKIEREIELTNKWAESEFKLSETMRKFGNKNANIVEGDTGVSKFNKYLNDQDLKRKEKESTPQLDNLKLDKNLPSWFNAYTEAIDKNDEAVKQSYKDYKAFAHTISKDVTTALFSVWDSMQKGENPLQAIGNAFAKIAEQIAFAVVEAAIFESILTAFPELKGVFAAVGGLTNGLKFGAHAEGGITTGPSLGLIGEAGPEAILPLSKLGSMMNSTFNAGAMSGGGGGGNGQFVLRGQDLLLAVNRSQKASSIKGQTISLA